MPPADIALCYNGEIYNFKELREELLSKGISFQSNSDTEALLYAYITYKEKCLNLLNGFFAFTIYDEKENTLFAARDRYGIKPFYYLDDDDKFIFASDMHAVLAYGIKKELDFDSLYTYLQLNYTPAPNTMIKGIKMLRPGTYLTLKGEGLKIHQYYRIDYEKSHVTVNKDSYERQKNHLKELLEESVKSRLISDVPLGTFLSGGIDSSIISGIAKKYKDDLHTFSIGYKDEPFFDETKYANLVAKKFGTRHTVFSLTNEDLYEHVFDILDRMDQPFADSSAIPTYILSKKTREHITVALSGDGADELFSGYNKHAAHYRAMQKNSMNYFIKTIGPLLQYLPKSRNKAFANRIRQAEKFGIGLNLSQAERYWRWASILPETKVMHLFNENSRNQLSLENYNHLKAEYLEPIKSDNDFNELLEADMQLVLPNDMLRKVDLMSMAHGLEVRVPFLDHHIIAYAFQLPVASKINGQMKKRILQDTFRDLIPAELYNRPKQGFEVPLKKWFKTSMKSMIKDDLLGDQFIESQNIFDPIVIRKLKKQLFSINPGDAHATIWALIVFQWWWKKYFG
jgi:asparagine synthase (glutamine-hydrolysing)